MLASTFPGVCGSICDHHKHGKEGGGVGTRTLSVVGLFLSFRHGADGDVGGISPSPPLAWVSPQRACRKLLDSALCHAKLCKKTTRGRKDLFWLVV